MTDNRTPDERSMNDKILNLVEGEGLTLTPAEAAAFTRMMGAMHQRQVKADERLCELQGLNVAMSAALYRKRLQVVHTEHDDGSVSFDLQPKGEQPSDAEPTRH